MNSNYIREIDYSEVKLLKPLMENLAFHHNNVSINFKGSYPRHLDKERIARFEKEIKEGKSKAFCCFENDKIVGVIKIDIDTDCGVIDYLVVKNEYQAQGYGKALMDIALETFKKYEVKNIELHVVYGNDAVNFYEKFGFKKQSYIMELRRQYE